MLYVNKFSRNGEIILPFSDVGNPSPSRDLLSHIKVGKKAKIGNRYNLLTLFEKNNLLGFLNLQYNLK